MPNLFRDKRETQDAAIGLETVQTRRNGDVNEAEAAVVLQMLNSLTRFISKHKL